MQIPILACPSVELARPRTAPDSNNTPQVFYTTQDIEAHFLKDPDRALAVTVVETERPTGVSPLLEDGEDMATFEVEVEAPRANQKRKRDQLAWDYRDETGGDGGGGGGGEDVSEGEVVLGAGWWELVRCAGVSGVLRSGLGMHDHFPLV